MLSVNAPSAQSGAAQSDTVLAVPFDQMNRVYVEYKVAGATVFQISETQSKVPGATVTYRLIGNGVDVPTFKGFKEMSGSAGYDGRAGSINVIQYFFDGVDCWYSIFHAKNPPEVVYPVVLQFLTRTSGVVQNGPVYQAMSGGPFEQYMISSQSIPANRDGQIICLTDDQVVLGLITSPQLQPYPTWQYKIWATPETYYSGMTDVDIVDSKLPYRGRSYLKLSRKSGVVRCEISPDNRTWNVLRAFPRASNETLYVAVALTASTQTPKTLTVVACEVAV